MEDVLNQDYKLIKELTNKIPGLLLAGIIGFLGKYLANWIPNIGGVTFAIILGLIYGNIVGVKPKYNIGVKFAKKKLLSIAIMLMGLKLEITVLSQIGLSAIMIIVVMVVSTIILGFCFGQLLGLTKSFSLLLGIGNAVCGSSAIAATAPLVTKKEEEIGLSIGIVNLLGTIGIFLLPILTYTLDLNDVNSGLMIGGTLQAVGQVVASGFSVNTQVGKLATVIKMGRILMLGPVVLGLGLFQNQANDNFKQGVTIPSFIIGFFILSIIGNFNLLPLGVISFLKNFSKILLIIAMAAIGLEIEISTLVSQGPKSLLVGILIFASQLLLITTLINLLL